MPNRTDSFTRSDNAATMGTPSDGGSDWLYPAPAKTWGIAANRARYTGAGESQAIALLESALADCDVQATLSAVSTDDGFAVRATDDDNYYVVVINTDAISLFKKEAGSFASAATAYSGAISNGDVIRIHCEGTAITVYQNAVLRVTSSPQSFNLTATKHGLRSNDSALAARWDDFSITALGGTPATYSPAALMMGL